HTFQVPANGRTTRNGCYSLSETLRGHGCILNRYTQCQVSHAPGRHYLLNRLRYDDEWNTIIKCLHNTACTAMCDKHLCPLKDLKLWHIGTNQKIIWNRAKRGLVNFLT